MPALYNLARMTSTTTGSSNITLGSAYAGFLTFAQAGVAGGEQVYYAINDPGTSPTQSEIGYATYNSSNTTLTDRTPLTSTSSNAAITLSGNAHVFISPPKQAWREVLIAARTYYVRTDGSDSNTGLIDSSGGAFLTIQKGIDTVAALDLSTFNVTIQVNNGAYTQSLTLKDPVSGGGLVTLVGSSATPGNVTIDVAGSCITTQSGSILYRVRGFSLNTSGSAYLINASNLSFLSVGAMTYRGSGFAHLGCINSATLQLADSYSISSHGAGYHWYTEGEGHITCQGRTITVSSGGPNFSAAFANCTRGSVITCNANTFTFSSYATGSRYSVSAGGLIDTGGAGATYLPGDAAGAGTNYGVSPYGLYN